MQVMVNDIERMIRLCRKELNQSGLAKELKLRAIAKPSLRKREKERLSAQRKRRQEKKRIMRNKIESVYDKEIRKRDRDIRIFNLRHAIPPDSVGGNREDGKVS